MTNFTANQVLKALSEKFPNEDLLYEEIGWEFYDAPNCNNDEHIK